MEKKYWTGRARSARAMARKAATSEARLIHYELAGRHSIKAAQCTALTPPGGRALAGAERPVLHLRAPALLQPTEVALPKLEPRVHLDVARTMGEGR